MTEIPMFAGGKKVADLTPPTARSQRLEAKPKAPPAEEESLGDVAARLSASAGEGGEASPGPVADGTEKPAKPKKERKPKGPKSPSESKSRFKKLYPDSAVVALKVDGNPKRPGSAAHGRFALYGTGCTVAEFLKGGGLYADLSWDVGHGFIEVSLPETVKEPQPEAETPAAAE